MSNTLKFWLIISQFETLEYIDMDSDMQKKQAFLRQEIL